MSEIYDTKAIRDSLTTRWLGRRLLFLEEVGSTNDHLRQMASGGEPAGTVVVTDYQSKGKGRRGRAWEADPGTSLLFSLLLRPSWKPERSGWLTMLAGVAAATAVNRVAGVAAGLKWPNDLVVAGGDGWQKLGGLLLEAEVEDGLLSSAVLGIGINVNTPAGQLPDTKTPATSLLVHTGSHVPRAVLLVAILSRIESLYEAAENGLSPHDEWNQWLVMLGRQVQITGGGMANPLAGIAESTDSWGRLLVRDSEGELHAVSAADVSLRG